MLFTLRQLLSLVGANKGVIVEGIVFLLSSGVLGVLATCGLRTPLVLYIGLTGSSKIPLPTNLPPKCTDLYETLGIFF